MKLNMWRGLLILILAVAIPLSSQASEMEVNVGIEFVDERVDSGKPDPIATPKPKPIAKPSGNLPNTGNIGGIANPGDSLPQTGARAESWFALIGITIIALLGLWSVNRNGGKSRETK